MAVYFVCPSCHGDVASAGGVLHCGACNRTYPCLHGIHRFLLDERPSVERFHEQYRLVRSRDGSLPAAVENYQQLPEVAADDPRAHEWQIRREGYATLREAVRARQRQLASPIRVADLGAGNGWLSHRLTQAGCEAVAVDRLDDEADGLGVARHYGLPFTCVQADFDRLPFPSASFDVVVLNGSLHYSADPMATIGEARRVLTAGGTLVVMDSPMFARDDDGEAMVASQQRAFAHDFGIADAVRQGVGFLTFARLEHATEAAGLHGRFVPSRGPIGWRVRRQLARVRLHRAPAAFGVWVAQ